MQYILNYVHSNMLNFHWNGDVSKQRFVISPRTEILHAWLSPKSDNLASWKNDFLFCIFLKDYNSSLIICETK